MLLDGSNVIRGRRILNVVPVAVLLVHVLNELICHEVVHVGIHEVEVSAPDKEQVICQVDIGQLVEILKEDVGLLISIETRRGRV